MQIKTVNIIGAGNVANFFAKSLSKDLDIRSIYSRSLSNAQNLADKIGSRAVNKLSLISDADLQIIAVGDDGIEEVSSQLPEAAFVVHTSGSVGIEVFGERSRCGVLYPLQTLTKERNVDTNEIPFLIEASSKELETSLMDFARTYFSKKTIVADSETREQIHLAAVLVNNFTNHLYTEAEKLLNKVDVDLSILHPLMIETVQKAIDLGPTAAQTGPAKRNDQKVISKQINKLENENLRTLYKLFSELIAKNQANS